MLSLDNSLISFFFPRFAASLDCGDVVSFPFAVFSVFIIKRTGLMASVLQEVLPVYFDFRISVGMFRTGCEFLYVSSRYWRAFFFTLLTPTTHSISLCRLLLGPTPSAQTKPVDKDDKQSIQDSKNGNNKAPSENCEYIALRHVT